jgi:hypothetical protein
MLYISICITLLTLLASLFYLSKIKSEGLGMLHKVITWVVIVTAGVILICQVAQGCKRMFHRSGKCHGNTTSFTRTESTDGGMKIRKEIRKVRGSKIHETYRSDDGRGEMPDCHMSKACCVMCESNCSAMTEGDTECSTPCGTEKMHGKNHDGQSPKIIKDSVVIIK